MFAAFSDEYQAGTGLFGAEVSEGVDRVREAFARMHPTELPNRYRLRVTSGAFHVGGRR